MTEKKRVRTEAQFECVACKRKFWAKLAGLSGLPMCPDCFSPAISLGAVR